MPLADFLEPKDRDAVLGDLAESSATRREARWQIASLLVRRNWGTWILSIATAVWLTLSITVLCRASHLWFFVLRNYRDLDTSALADTGLRWRDIILHFASSAWLPAGAAFIAGLLLAKRSRQTTALNLVLFVAVSTIAMLCRSFTLHHHTNPTAASAIFLESTIIWMPLIIGTRLRRTA